MEALLKSTSLVVLISDLLGRPRTLYPPSTGYLSMSWW